MISSGAELPRLVISLPHHQRRRVMHGIALGTGVKNDDECHRVQVTSFLKHAEHLLGTLVHDEAFDNDGVSHCATLSNRMQCTMTSCRQAATPKATGPQIRSQCRPRDRCDIMSTKCCSVESDKIPNQIVFWTKGSSRSWCSTPNWMSCTMTSCRELSLIESIKIPNLIIFWTKSGRRAKHRIGCNALQEQVRINLGSTNTPFSSANRAVGA